MLIRYAGPRLWAYFAPLKLLPTWTHRLANYLAGAWRYQQQGHECKVHGRGSCLPRWCTRSEHPAVWFYTWRIPHHGCNKEAQLSYSNAVGQRILSARDMRRQSSCVRVAAASARYQSSEKLMSGMRTEVKQHLLRIFVFLPYVSLLKIWKLRQLTAWFCERVRGAPTYCGLGPGNPKPWCGSISCTLSIVKTQKECWIRGWCFCALPPQNHGNFFMARTVCHFLEMHLYCCWRTFYFQFLHCFKKI